jgi:hypothetical protein
MDTHGYFLVRLPDDIPEELFATALFALLGRRSNHRPDDFGLEEITSIAADIPRIRDLYDSGDEEDGDEIRDETEWELYQALTGLVPV